MSDNPWVTAANQTSQPQTATAESNPWSVAASRLQPQTPQFDNSQPTPELKARAEFNINAGLNNIVNFGKNAINDVQDLTQGMTAMGSELMARGRTSAQVPFIHSNLNRNLWNDAEAARRGLPAGTQMPADEDMAGAMVPAIAGDFKQKYIDPAIEGGATDFIPSPLQAWGSALRGGKPADPRALMKYPNQFFNHPVQTTLDVAPVLPGAGKVVSTAGKIANKVGLTRVAAKLVPQEVKAASAIQKVFGNADKNFKAWSRQTDGELFNLYNQIPPEVQKQLIPGAEFTDEAATITVSQSPQAQAFLAKVREYNNVIKKKALEHGLATEDDFLKAEYGPSFLAGNPGMTAAELDHVLPQLREMKAAWDQAGSTPTYFGVLFKQQVARGHQPSMLHDFAKSLDQTTAKDTPGFLENRTAATAGTVDGMSTIRTTGHSMDAMAVATKRIQEGYRFFAIKDAVDDLFKHPGMVNVPNGVPFDAASFLQKVGAGAGLSKENIAALVNQMGHGQIQLPKATAEYLKHIAEAMDAPERMAAGAIETAAYKNLYQKPAQILKRWLLGYDLSWPGIQWVQGAMMFGSHAFEGPQHIVSSIAAAAMSLVPKYRNLVPKELLADYNALTKLAPEGNKILNALKNVVDFIPDKVVYPLTNAVDNHWRIAGTLYEAMKRNGFKPPTAENLKAVIEQSHGDITKRIYDHYGDYGTPGSALSRAANDTVMFMPWLVNAARFGKTMVKEHPWKTSALSQAAQQAPNYLQDKENTPSYALQGGAVPFGKDPQGNPQVMWKPGMLPHTQVLQTTQQIAGLTSGELGADPRGVSFNPTWNIPAYGMAAVDSKLKFNFKPPNLVEYGNTGLYMTQEQFKQMEETGEVPKNLQEWRPNTVDTAAQKVFPREYLLGTRVKEFPGLPSDQSTLLGEKAPKRINGGEIQKGIHGDNFVQMLLEYGPPTWGRFAPTQLPYDASTEEAIGASQRKKTILKERIKNRNKEDEKK